MKNSRFVRFVVDRALENGAPLSIAERATLYRGIALAFRSHDKKASALASSTAAFLQQAERHQLQFRELLKGGDDESKK